VRSPERDALQAHLRATGIETLIHYPLALTEQPAFARLAPTTCPHASRAAKELLSLPLHPRLEDATVGRIVDAIVAFQKGRVLT
jgi:dTDP-4-amino-4,6-dideoxygalactose transaminase